jgi:PRTRC genetic system protein E
MSIISKFAQIALTATKVTVHFMTVEKDGVKQILATIEPIALEALEKYPALSQPLQVLTTMDELEEELIKALEKFTPAYTDACNNITEIQGDLEAATKAAREKATAKQSAKSAVKMPVKKAGDATSQGMDAKPKEGDGSLDEEDDDPAFNPSQLKLM